MPRAHYPHSLHDITHAVDGPLGLVVGDLADGSIWILKRGRKEPGYTLTHYADAARSSVLATRHIAERIEAVNAMADAIVLGEKLGR